LTWSRIARDTGATKDDHGRDPEITAMAFHRLNPLRVFRWAVADRASVQGPGRRRRRASAVSVVLGAPVLAYLLILIFPEVLFAHHIRHRNFDVYSEIPLDAKIIPILDEAATLMERSPLNDPGMEHRLFLCDTPFKRRWLAPALTSPSARPTPSC
jgi:hypothetical protein